MEFNYDPYDIAYANIDLDESDIALLRSLENPLLINKDEDYPGLAELRLMRNADYFYWSCKTLLNIEIIPEQAAILEELWTRAFPMYIASRGFGKTFMLAVYCWLKLIMVPGTKIVVAGAAFRQSKFVLDYMKTIWDNSPILQSICNKSTDGMKVEPDKITMKFNGGFATAIPIGNGDKIRGLRANIVIGEEFASHNPEIWETVIRGFTSVSSNPVQGVKEEARKRKLQKAGLWTPEMEMLNKSARRFNQSIITGTADYAFKHFAKYWKRYKSIIESRGDVTKLLDVFPDGVPDGFNWRDYSVIRIPYELIPPGFMDEKSVAQAKATIHSGNYLCEYGATFAEDSDGFFKRSLIESCVVSSSNPINGIEFDPRVIGDQSLHYVMGVDPASEHDNFTIVVLEIHPTHNRVVYCWSTNRKEFKKKLQVGLTQTHDFYGYTARKIREIMRTFPIVAIALDSQGGGVAVEEALQDPDKRRDDELAIYRVKNPEKPAYTDGMQGLHILHMINFADYKWTCEANHGLKMDMENKTLLFPMLNPVLLAIDYETNQKGNELITSMYDTIEDCSLEIEYLKDELSTIVHTNAGNGQSSREKWDTPETKTATGRKGRMRKDRYSSLIMANMVARQMRNAILPPVFGVIGGAAHEIEARNVKGQQMYQGNDEWASISEDCFISVSRGGF